MKIQSNAARNAYLPLPLVIAGLVLSACSQGPQSLSSQASSGVAPATSRSVAAGAGSENHPGSNAVTSAAVTSVAAFTLFSEPVPSELTNNQCGLDGINDQPAASAGPVSTANNTYFSGWAGDGKNSSIDAGFFVLKGMNTSYSVPVVTGDARPDLVKSSAENGMRNAGFHMTTSLKDVEPGTYSLFVVKSSDPSSACDLHLALTVK